MRAAAIAVAVGVGDTGSVETGEGDGISLGDGVGAGDSCANTTVPTIKAIPIRNPHFAIRISNIIAPIDIREQVVTGLALGQKIFIQGAANELVVEVVEPRKVIERSLGSVFPRRSGTH